MGVYSLRSVVVDGGGRERAVDVVTLVLRAWLIMSRRRGIAATSEIGIGIRCSVLVWYAVEGRSSRVDVKGREKGREGGRASSARMVKVEGRRLEEGRDDDDDRTPPRKPSNVEEELE